MKLCVSNGRIVDTASGTDAVGSVWIDGGRIAAVTLSDEAAPDWSGEDVGVIDASGKWVTPGLIDLHVHFREPGFEAKEDTASGSLAAARGGFTTVCCMPNTKPAIHDAAVVEYIDEKAEATGLVNVLPVGAVTMDQDGKVLADIKGMVAADTHVARRFGKGVCALSEDGKSVMDAALLLEGMKLAAELGLPMFSHAEDTALAGSALGEQLITARDILLSKDSGCQLHFCHVSNKGSIDLIRLAKAEGLPVTAETAPHYFALNQEDEKGDGNKKMNPRLRTEEDAEAIRRALRDGIIEVIATDHAPHRPEEKNCAFEEAVNGVTGLETSFGVSYSKLVLGGWLTPLQLISRMSTDPARILGIERGSLAVGSAADIAVFDVENEYEVREEDFASKGKNSAFLGMKLRGKAVCTITGGKVVWKENDK